MFLFTEIAVSCYNFVLYNENSDEKTHRVKEDGMILTPPSTPGTNTAGQRTDSGGKRVLLLD